MTNPEHDLHGGPEKMSFIEKLRLTLCKLLKLKTIEELEEKGREAHKKKLEKETKEAHRREEQIRKQKDLEREYRKRKTEKEEKESAQTVREEIITQKAVERLRDVVERRLNAQGKLKRREAEGAEYLVGNMRRDPQVLERLIEAMGQSSEVARIVDALVSQDSGVHGDAAELIKQAQRVFYAAQEVGQEANVASLLEALTGRVKELVSKERPLRQQIARRQKTKEPKGAEWLGAEAGIVLTDEEKEQLKDENRWAEAVESMITTRRPELPPEEAQKAAWTEVEEREGPVYEDLVGEFDEVWKEVERREKQGQPLTVDELKTVERKIFEKESVTFPRDVLAGTQAYQEAVKSIRDYTEERLDKLAEKLNERILTETPEIRTTTQKEFLVRMATNPGYLGRLLQDNPEMVKLLVGTGKESVRFRNKVFLTIHAAVLTQRREGSRENFGLYERADFTTFTRLLASRMADLTRPETGQSHGRTWVDWYVGLSNTIRLCRDIDFWASQPGAEIDSFNKSLAMFQNEYSSQALCMPAVEQAFRALETTLRSIQNSNDGYIPPALIDYSAGKMKSFWDETSENMLKKMVEQGVVFDMKRDRYGFHMVEEDGHTVALSNEALTEIDETERAMYMTLAKGFGMASGRLLEIFANSKVPGSKHPKLGMDGFHSIAYEGVAKALNYFSIFIHKWGIGSYRYFQFVNMLVPKGRRLPLERLDPMEAFKAYCAYRDGTFAQKYGEEAKRFIDSTNISKISSAWGPYTTWRQTDSTIGWSDKEKELLGGSIQIMLAEAYAEKKVKDYLVTGKYREKYREALKKRNQEEPSLRLSTSGPEFEKLWLSEGMEIHRLEIEKEWERCLGKIPLKGKLIHDRLTHDVKHLRKAYEKAFKARVWVEMAMRNPLGVAHNLKVKAAGIGLEKEREINLHSHIVQKVLGIPLEDVKYGTVGCKIRYDSTPTERQEQYMYEILDLEGDLAAVKERVMMADESRDLKLSDFEMIKDPKRRQHAIEYWNEVKKYILGSTEEGKADDLYKELGLSIGPDGENYAVDWHKIHDIDKTLEKAGGDKLEEAVGKEMEWIFGTDDIAFRKMDLLNLGARQWLRRGGDIMAHHSGGEKLTDYLVNQIGPNPDVHDLAKALKEVRMAYEGDMIEAGWGMVSNFADLTARFYSWDWGRLCSPAQEVWGTRRNVAAWLANGRRKFWDALEHADVLPPHAHFFHYNVPEKTDIHFLRRQNRADNIDVWKEIIMLGFLLALAITVWRALTAPSEEEEGGRGGHH